MDYRYIAPRGEYLPGVPARDLTHDEVIALADRRSVPVKELRATLKASGLYALLHDGDEGKPAPKAKAAPKPPERAAEDKTPPVGPLQTGPTGQMIETQRAEPKRP